MTAGIHNPPLTVGVAPKPNLALVTIHYPATGETVTIDAPNAADMVNHLGWRHGAAPEKSAEAPR
jgi:hypothetical protein